MATANSSAAVAVSAGRPRTTPAALKPLGFVQALPFFAVPGLILAAFIWLVQPWLVTIGVSRPVANMLAFTIPNAGLVVASLVAYALEGNPMTWPAFAARFRLGRMTGRAWAWSLGGFVVFAAISIVLSNLLMAGYRALSFEPPSSGSTGGDNLLFVIVLFFNIVGEELWWRGYILPRQELAFGKRTWLVHGTLWACFHMFKPWALPALLINCQVVPFVAQRTRSTWPGMVIHLLGNGLGGLPILTTLILALMGGH